jgi:hypothetical protein
MTTERSDHFTYSQMTGKINLSTDTVKVLLMRSGYVFNKALHGKLINIKTNTGSIVFIWSAADNSVSRSAGSFITDGFVVGNQCTSNSAVNPGPFIIKTVTALKVTFNESIVNENGYTQNTKTTGTITVTEDTVNHYTSATFPTITFSGYSGVSGYSGYIGPTPGAVLMDDTSADKTIIGFEDFDGEQSATPGNPLALQNGTIRGL